MTRLRIALGLLVLTALPAAAQVRVEAPPPPARTQAGADSAFARGVEAYRQGRFGDAYAAFASAREGGYGAPELDYNLGLTLARMDSAGAAVAALLRARPAAGDSLRAAVDHNLRLVRTRAGVERAAPFVALPQERWASLVRGVGPAALFWTGWLLVALACVLAGLRAWTGRRSDAARRALLVLGPLGAALLLAAGAASMRLGVPQRAVLLEALPGAPAGTVVHLRGAAGADTLRARLPSGAVVATPREDVAQL